MVENLKESIGDEFLKDYGLNETVSLLKVEGKMRSCRVIRFGTNGGGSSKPLVSYTVDRIRGKQTLYLEISEGCSQLTQEQYRVVSAYIHASISNQEGEIQNIRFLGSLEVADDALQAFWNIKPPGRGKIKKK